MRKEVSGNVRVMPVVNFHMAMRFVFLLFLVLSASAHAGGDGPLLASAKQATRCGVLLLSLAQKEPASDPQTRWIYETVPGRLFARSNALGATRPMQEAWIAQMRLQSIAETRAQRTTRLDQEWPRCRPLFREEALPHARLDVLGKPN